MFKNRDVFSATIYTEFYAFLCYNSHLPDDTLGLTDDTLGMRNSIYIDYSVFMNYIQV